MNAKLLLLAAPMALAGVAPAHATVTFGDQTINNGAVLENVLIGNNQTGNPVTGTTNQSGIGVIFTSTTDTLLTSASGQAVITALDGFLNSVTFTLAGGATFTNFEFDLQKSLSSPQTVTLTTNLGTQVYPNAPCCGSLDGSGANWAGAAANGEYFTSVTWSGSGSGFDNMKQLRLGGIAAAVPEASTWAMMLLGLGGIGWALRRKRRVATTAQISFA